MMSFIKILSIAMCLNTSTPDTMFRVCSVADTIYITSDDVAQIDTFGLFHLTYHLSKEMCDSLDSMNYNSCQIYYHLKNKDWILLQEYEMRRARIPEGYYITTNFGTIVYKENRIHIGYNYPDKLKKNKRKFCKRYLTQPKF